MEYKIYNFRPFGTDLSSSEMIKKKPSILKPTLTHCLGSGIYGIIDKTRENIQDKINDNIEKELILEKPFIINNNEELSVYIIFARAITELCVCLKNIKKSDTRDEKAKDLLEIIKKNTEIINNTVNKIEYVDILQHIITFIKQYTNMNNGDFITQPINFVLYRNGYDGIYNNCDNGDNFARGSVKYDYRNPRHQKWAFGLEDPYLKEDKNLITPESFELPKKIRKTPYSRQGGGKNSKKNKRTYKKIGKKQVGKNNKKTDKKQAGKNNKTVKRKKK
jgi:hypothetical protein